MRLALRRRPPKRALQLRPDANLAPGEVHERPGPPRTMALGSAGLEGTGAWEALGARAVVAAGTAERLALDGRGLTLAAAMAFGAGALLRASRPPPRPSAEARDKLRDLSLLLDEPAAAETPWARIEAALAGQMFARALVAEPANRLTPQEFAVRLRRLEREGLKVEVLGRARLRAAGARALLAVGAASAHPPRLVILRWRGEHRAPPVAFVGKGICFDTGGVSIKPAEGMEAMRADMAGAAACAGAMLALARRRSPCPAVAVLALAENAIGAAAYRPGDVLRTASGRTVEVVDTDAEGRLVLADALHVAASRFKPRALLDVATLTGSVVIALGHHRAGLFGNDAALMTAVASAGEAVGEHLWPLPIGAQHRADLASGIADLRHCLPAGSGAWGGRLLPDACHAAAFLKEFADGTPWAHLDIAGVETEEGSTGLVAKGMPTGFGARLLDALIERHFEDPHRL
jgi:leucyl aminopeptidase